MPAPLCPEQASQGVFRSAAAGGVDAQIAGKRMQEAVHQWRVGIELAEAALALIGVQPLIGDIAEQARHRDHVAALRREAQRSDSGGPQSGKSTFLRTLIASLALTHTPTEAQFYCLDFGGGGLTQLAQLAHTTAVAVRSEGDRVGRIVAEISDLLVRREALFAANAVDSMATYRAARRAGRFPEDEHGDVFLVVDGWATLRQEFRVGAVFH